MLEMTTQEAVKLLTTKGSKATDFKPITMYRIGKTLSISPIMIGHYKYGRNKMGLESAKVFEYVYGIKITDANNPGRKPNEDCN